MCDRAIFLVLFSVLPGCHDASDTEDSGAYVVYEASAPVGPCDAVEQQRWIEGQAHVPECLPIQYRSNPPSSGDHYGVWAAFKIYSNAIPEGYWVHDLEHGAIVLTHNCPDGCDADVAAAAAMLDGLPADPACLASGNGVRGRNIMTPDPKLDVPFAASAWGYTLRAKCFDPDAFRSFAMRHRGQAPEELCADGTDFSAGVAPACGGP